MYKKSQFVGVWPKIYQKLKNPPPGINLGSFPSKLPPFHKIIIDQNRLSENPRAIGYVSTEDVNSDGILDTIHVASPRLEEAMRSAGIPMDKMQNIDQLTKEELLQILTPFVDLFSHEMGHLKDYNPNQTNPFPGGENVAEMAGRNAIQNISVAATTNNNKRNGENMVNNKVNDKILSLLVNLGDYFDKKGSTKSADYVDYLLKKYSQDSAGAFGKGTVGDMPDMTPIDIPLSDSSPFKEKQMTSPIAKQTPKQGPKGQIQRPGDPYTFDFDSVGEFFIIKTTPNSKSHLIGKKIGPGDPGYRELMDEAVSMGLVKDISTAPDMKIYPGSEKKEPQFYPSSDLGTEAAFEDETLKKIASLKENYDKIFWTAPTTPFYRSNTKFNDSLSNRLKTK